MKHRLTPFACILALCALTTCSNPELLTLLRAPSELLSLEIVAYAGDTQLEGGAAMEPGFTSSVFQYIVYVSKDTERFTVNAKLNGKGTIDIMCEEDQETGKEHDFFPDEEFKVMILTVEREYMEVAEYRVTVIREEAVPVATGVEISITPAIAAFFIGSGVFHEFEVKANLPAAGGELSYQWYMNTSNSNRGGSRINGATDATYTMKPYETMIAETVYYYAEIINTIDGKTGVTESLPCRVTFLNKDDLHEKSLAMVDIPAGEVTPEKVTVYWGSTDYAAPIRSTTWSTPGFSMGQYLVTWELWKFVFDHAEAGNYRFINLGNQGVDLATIGDRQPFGNELNPVALISWRDAVVWCNAYSEMDGRAPVYRDSAGEPLRDSRVMVERLIDPSAMIGKNGYRLPTPDEWEYAGRGANPSTSAPWTDRFAGTDTEYTEASSEELAKYFWSRQGTMTTGEVGSLLPNSIGLYDMMGMLYQYVYVPDLLPTTQYPDPNVITYAYGRGFDTRIYEFDMSHGVFAFTDVMGGGQFELGAPHHVGLRIACSQGGAQ